jgi:hypothetical protein
MTDDSLAKQRFATLGLLRFSGVAVAIVGLLLLGEKLSVIGPAIDRMLGGALVIIGIFAVLILPTLIARRWKSSDRS